MGFKIHAVILFKNGDPEIFLPPVEKQMGKMSKQRMFILFRIDLFPENSAVSGNPYFTVFIVQLSKGCIITFFLSAGPGYRVAGNKQDPDPGIEFFKDDPVFFRIMLSVKECIESADPFTEKINFKSAAVDPFQIGITNVVKNDDVTT